MLWKKWQCCENCGRIVKTVAELWKQWQSCENCGRIVKTVAVLWKQWQCRENSGSVVKTVAVSWKQWQCCENSGSITRIEVFLWQHWICPSENTRYFQLKKRILSSENQGSAANQWICFCGKKHKKENMPYAQVDKRMFVHLVCSKEKSFMRHTLKLMADFFF